MTKTRRRHRGSAIVRGSRAEGSGARATSDLPAATGDEAVVTRSFADRTTSVAEARHFVAATLGRWGCERLIDDAQLVVSELVTNAVIHAHTPAHLVVTLRVGRLRIEVTDGGHGSLRPQPWDGRRLGGRGLLIVDRLAERWGVAHDTDGKSVWVELS